MKKIYLVPTSRAFSFNPSAPLALSLEKSNDENNITGSNYTQYEQLTNKKSSGIWGDNTEKKGGIWN